MKLALIFTLAASAHAGTIFGIPVDLQDVPRFDIDGFSVQGSAGWNRPIVPGIWQVACPEDWIDFDGNDACYQVSPVGDLFYLGGISAWAQYDTAQIVNGQLEFSSPSGIRISPSPYILVGYESTPRSDTPEPKSWLLMGAAFLAAFVFQKVKPWR